MQEVDGDNDFSFRILSSGRADFWALRLEAMDPWSRLGISRKTLAALLTTDSSRLECFEIFRAGEAAGVIAVQPGWLIGPYLKLLAILEEHQGAGAGGAALSWFERRNQENNTWLCVSEFNLRARTFYERNGYRLVGRLDGLIVPTEAELLYRKTL